MAAKVAARRDPYIGEIKNHLREGYGIYNYDNKFFRYEGEWKDGKKHGHGKLIMGDGGYYEGEFQEGEIEGHGFRLFGLNGNKYSGQFLMGEMHGQGIMTFSNGSVYEGEWCRNLRDGFGILREADGQIYQGNMHANKRHGEGTQIYSNGDRYDGDWVLDKRQGHGELRSLDGTIYDGQWANGTYNGQGTIHHSSGVIYEGLWINGRPASTGVKLAFEGIDGDSIEVVQGTPFDLKIVCQNESGETVEVEGRELRLTAGFKHQPTLITEEKQKEESRSGLFDVIEDIEEKATPTPFGYDVVSYPITDQLKLDNVAETEGQNAQIAEDNADEQEEGTEQTGETDESERDKTVDDSAEQTGNERSDSPTVVTSSDQTHNSDQTGPALEGAPLPPPVGNLRTKGGAATFQNLILTAAPPMYRPFVLLEEERKRKTKDENSDDSENTQETKLSAKSSKKSKSEDKPSKKEKIQLGDERFARPDTSASAYGEIADEDEEGETLLNPNAALPGEYVIIVEDVTDPPFMDMTLTPVYLQVKVVLPKKVKKPIKKKDKGPN